MKEKIKCDECGREFVVGNRPDGLPNGIGFELEDGTIRNVCTDCLIKIGEENFNMYSGMFEGTVGERIATGKMTIEEYEKEINRNYRKEAIEDICEFVKSDEFTQAWCLSKGERFGDFVEKILREKFLGEPYEA